MRRFAWLLLFIPSVLPAADPIESQFRRPVAAASIGPRLFVANRDSGSISIVDLQNRQVISESRIGERLTDLADLGRQRLVVVDHAKHQLLLIDTSGERCQLAQQVATPRYPLRAVVDQQRRRILVAGLWSRQLAVYSYDPLASSPVSLRATVDLSVAPRELCLTPDERYAIVADAFAGKLELVDLEANASRGVRTIPGHSIGGLCTTGRGENARLLIAHQVTQSLAPTTRSRVFWGNVVGNVLRGVDLSELLRPAQETNAVGHYDLLPLGEPNHGTGDPGRLAVNSEGKTVVCLSGVGEVAMRPAPDQPMARYAVGQRPTSVCLSADGERAFVTNTLSDSVSLIDVQRQRVVDTISLGPSPRMDAVRRGEMIFYDAKVSLDGWFSCHSCHVDGHTNEQLNDNFGDESEGAPKRVPSLLGVTTSGPWSWSGTRGKLHEQLHKSIVTTMRREGEPITDRQLQDLEAYLSTLGPAPSILAARGADDLANVRRGKRVFTEAGCIQCHAPPSYTSPETYDIGIHDELGRKEFNPPSLRGVSQRSHFFHDNRAGSLSEVLRLHGEIDRSDLDDQSRRDLIAFLKSL